MSNRSLISDYEKSTFIAMKTSDYDSYDVWDTR